MAQGRWGSNRGLDGKGRSRGKLGSPRGATRIEAGRILAAVDDRHGRQASRQAGRGGLGGVCGRKERIVVRKKEKRGRERAGICMAEMGGGPDPVFFSLSYKTHVKFFISPLFPSVSFTIPLPSLPLSLPFAAAPLSHLFTCLNSLLPGHIDV